MKERSGDLLRLQHILNCINDLEEILKNVDDDTFYRDKEKKYAVERLLEIIGEAVRNISAGTLAKSNKNIPWRDVIDFRNLITHEYFRVDYTLVYNIATKEIPILKSVIEHLIENTQSD